MYLNRSACAAARVASGNLKTAIAGTYHAFNFANYTPRYLADFQFCTNHRYRLDLTLVATASLSGALRAANEGSDERA